MIDSEAIFGRYLRPLLPIPTGLAPQLGPMKRFKAILFDVYGTLLISGAGDIGANQANDRQLMQLSSMMHRYAVEGIPHELLAALNAAVRSHHRFRQGEGDDFPEIDIIRIWQQVLESDDEKRAKCIALSHELIVNPVYPMPGFSEMLHHFNTQQTPIGIISNAQFFTVLLLERFLGGSLNANGFDHELLFFSWKQGCAKPSPVMFERAKAILEKRGIAADAVLFVGNDMLNDVLPAATAGFNTALFAGDQRSLRQRKTDARCRDRSPDLIITDLRQLITAFPTAHQ